VEGARRARRYTEVITGPAAIMTTHGVPTMLAADPTATDVTYWPFVPEP